MRGAAQVVGRQREFTNQNARAKRLRKKMTPAEQRLWSKLTELEGWHFRKQAAVGPHVFDFAEMSARLLIEVDGGIHYYAPVKLRDDAKEAWAVGQGFTVLRIPNACVFGTGEPAMQMVIAALRASVRDR